ncbi:unnamed protein product, partial [Mesorhabditis belari]|uniref:Uncharacterized protein n=1 Tax=Mesorhabditis belari TaxID=2138241 RepID=A0AAF3FQM3_9BILA
MRMSYGDFCLSKNGTQLSTNFSQNNVKAMPNDQPLNKRKRHYAEELEGTSTTSTAAFSTIPQTLSTENNLPSWTAFEHEKDMPFTQSIPQYQEFNQPQPHQPHQLPPPSDGFDLTNLCGNMNLEMNHGEIVDPVYSNNTWFATEQSVDSYLDQRPPEAFNTAYPGYFQGSDQFGFESYSMGRSQEDLRDPDQPGPSHLYHTPQPKTLFDFDFNEDLRLSVSEDAVEGNEGRVRDERNNLLEDWKVKDWKSSEWKKLEEHCTKSFGCLPPPPPPAILYERKKNGRKMHPENEIDPYFHLTDKDALTLMEGKRRGNEMLKTGITSWYEAADKQEAAKQLWKEILGRVINNRQSTAVKNRSTDAHGHFSRATMQVCEAASRYRDLLVRLFNGQMMGEDAQREMNSIDQTILVPDEEGRTLLSRVRDFAETEANKKPTTRQKTMPKDEKNNKDKKKK